MLKNLTAVLSVTALLAGCSSIKNAFTDPKLTVAIKAQPATAELYLNGSPCGQGASKFISVKLTNGQLERGTYIIDVPEARWPSGTVVPQTRRSLSLDKLSHHIVISHPNPDSAAGRFDRLAKHSFEVAYKASPGTAKIYLDGTLLGQSPATKTFEITMDDFEKGFIALPAVEARWPSGSTSEKEISKIKLGRYLAPRRVELSHPAPDTPAGKFDRQKKHSVTVRYHSEPALALLFSSRDNLGRAPASRTYTYSFADYERGYLELEPMQARWTSGAMTNSGPIEVQLNGATQEITLIRPEHPSLGVDLEVVRHEEEKARQEKTEARHLELTERHYRKMEQIENEKLQLEKEKLELLERKQAAEEKERKELLRLKKLEVENELKKQQEAQQ